MTPPPAADLIEPSAVAPPVRRPCLLKTYRTIAVPEGAGRFWLKLGAFAGPGYLVAVGYMDPGNWATDLAGGSAFGYTLLSVILLSNLMAMVLQSLSAKLGIVGLTSPRPAANVTALRSAFRFGFCANSRSAST